MSWVDVATVIVENLPTPTGGSDQSQVATIYGAIALVIVALIGAASSYLIAKATRKEALHPNSRTARTARQHEAWERWLWGNDFDPRKIKTGYESIEEVRRAP